MKDLRRRFNRFCFSNRDKGIPNLMLYIVLATAGVYLLDSVDPSHTVVSWLYFDRALILRGQLWRLVTFPLCYDAGSIMWTAISLICYYSLGQAIENVWGTLRFNLFYGMGILLMDVYCMILGGYADAYYLNLSLFLAYATLYPDAQFLIMFIIPIKAWVLALVDLVLLAAGFLFGSFPGNLFPIIALGNYFLFFGKDVLNVLPMSWRVNAQRAAKKATNPGKKGKTIPFNPAGSYQASHASVKAPYTHKCTVCGRTDVSDPKLEFRYCSRCQGYHCYCMDHISNHSHIQ